ncbi:hypothetical protein ODZ84_02560 [Chryseobacterium fluminis]|uniref:hypothetical protein n=1 Tax=Chryseobacterium fluminis TaxID=2983606 RepID=UPI00225B364E|nr:hypothetical protein [Chryseobacterium sp. MMS21-Ot14]UZT98473.1 hypothetical protein ODZ84_02560 [Chryseobacterium sp. MMS21-Ot14]
MKKILIPAILLLMLTSCWENRSENKPLIENAVDHADSSIKGSFESGRNDNMIDKIYSEIIKNDKKLSALDDKILKIYDQSGKVLKNYDDILNKSASYYRDANDQANAITDSLLKHEVQNEIKMSSDQYELKIKNVKNLISQLNTNMERINDLYTIFKIRKTLPEIEKYQNAHPLKTDSLENFVKKQNQLLNELKNLK